MKVNFCLNMLSRIIQETFVHKLRIQLFSIWLFSDLRYQMFHYTPVTTTLYYSLA